MVQELRAEDLYKVPGVSETIDWVTALVALDTDTLDAAAIDETLGVVLKAKEDRGNGSRTPRRRAARSGDAATRRGVTSGDVSSSRQSARSSAASCGAKASTSTPDACSTSSRRSDM